MVLNAFRHLRMIHCTSAKVIFRNSLRSTNSSIEEYHIARDFLMNLRRAEISIEPRDLHESCTLLLVRWLQVVYWSLVAVRNAELS